MKLTTSVSLLVAVVVAAAGCGGERCAHDTCEPGSEFDAVVAVPDTVVTGDMVLVNDADGVAGDAERDDVLADTGTDTLGQDVADDAACGGETPYLLDGKCVECRDSADCFDVSICMIPWHSCVLADCEFDDEIPCKYDGQCHECCDDFDCQRSGFTGVCLEDGTCQPDPDCQGKCTKDFPYCVWVGGAAQCVQCVEDEDCALAGWSQCVCTGDPLYACMDPADGSLCWVSTDGCTSPCSDSGDCPTTVGGGAMQCVEVEGLDSSQCVNPSGHCDGVSSCCAPRNSCYSLTAVLADILHLTRSKRFVDLPEELYAYCGCDTAADCLAGGPCTDTAIICDGSQAALGEYYDLLCPEGQLDSRFPGRLCIQPAALQEFFGITGT